MIKLAIAMTERKRKFKVDHKNNITHHHSVVTGDHKTTSISLHTIATTNQSVDE